MSVHEPMTLATDYLLTAGASVFAARLWRPNRMWALAFLFTAAGSFFGGTHHGFAPQMEPLVAVALWKLTLFAIGLASFFLLVGSGRPGRQRWLPKAPSGLSPESFFPRRLLDIIAIVKLVVYASWMISHDAFVWVILDYGATLLLVGVAQLAGRGPSTKWVIASIVVSTIGALVQQSGFALHRHFNHNDLYHVIQLAALWLLYRGGLLMTPSIARQTNPPT